MSGDLGAFITANFAYIYLSLWQFYLSVLGRAVYYSRLWLSVGYNCYLRVSAKPPGMVFISLRVPTCNALPLLLVSHMLVCLIIPVHFIELWSSAVNLAIVSVKICSNQKDGAFELAIYHDIKKSNSISLIICLILKLSTDLLRTTCHLECFFFFFFRLVAIYCFLSPWQWF